jgi:subtilisin family serine protease
VTQGDVLCVILPSVQPCIRDPHKPTTEGHVMKRSRFLILTLALLVLPRAIPASAQTVQSNPPNWALDRIDQRNGPLSSSYGYTTTGAGVHIYILDSGIRTDHAQFAGRLTVDADYVGPVGNGADCKGHGTAVAGIAAGSTYGVAKSAQIHVLRVWGCAAVPADDLPRFKTALQWVLTNHIDPAVVNISYNFSSEDVELRNLITALLNAGVVVVSSAGNAPGPVGEFWKMGSTACRNFYPQYCTVQPPTLDSHCPACPYDPYWDNCVDCSSGTCIQMECPYSTPAQTNLPPQVSGVITVGAVRYYSVSGQWDRRSKMTHWGVDVYAPGWQLLTASIAGPTATQLFSETSAAAPVVTGIVARYLQSHPAATPAQVRSWVKLNATFNTLTHAPQWEAGVAYMAPAE